MGRTKRFSNWLILLAISVHIACGINADGDTGSDSRNSMDGTIKGWVRADAVFPQDDVACLPFEAARRAYGWKSLLGNPVGPAQTVDVQETTQAVHYFELGKLSLNPLTNEVRMVDLGEAALQSDRLLLEEDLTQGDCSAQRPLLCNTTQSIRHGFAEYWSSNGGIKAFGEPLSAVRRRQSQVTLPNGSLGTSPILVQYFERARFELRDGRIVLGELGLEAALAAGVFADQSQRDSSCFVVNGKPLSAGVSIAFYDDPGAATKALAERGRAAGLGLLTAGLLVTAATGPVPEPVTKTSGLSMLVAGAAAIVIGGVVLVAVLRVLEFRKDVPFPAPEGALRPVERPWEAGPNTFVGEGQLVDIGPSAYPHHDPRQAPGGPIVPPDNANADSDCAKRIRLYLSWSQEFHSNYGHFVDPDGAAPMAVCADPVTRLVYISPLVRTIPLPDYYDQSPELGGVRVDDYLNFIEENMLGPPKFVSGEIGVTNVGTVAIGIRALAGGVMFRPTGPWSDRQPIALWQKAGGMYVAPSGAWPPDWQARASQGDDSWFVHTLDHGNDVSADVILTQPRRVADPAYIPTIFEAQDAPGILPAYGAFAFHGGQQVLDNHLQ